MHKAVPPDFYLWSLTLIFRVTSMLPLLPSALCALVFLGILGSSATAATVTKVFSKKRFVSLRINIGERKQLVKGLEVILRGEQGEVEAKVINLRKGRALLKYKKPLPFAKGEKIKLVFPKKELDKNSEQQSPVSTDEHFSILYQSAASPSYHSHFDKILNRQSEVDIVVNSGHQTIKSTPKAKVDAIKNEIKSESIELTILHRSDQLQFGPEIAYYQSTPSETIGSGSKEDKEKITNIGIGPVVNYGLANGFLLGFGYKYYIFQTSQNTGKKETYKYNYDRIVVGLGWTSDVYGLLLSHKSPVKLFLEQTTEGEDGITRNLIVSRIEIPSELQIMIYANYKQNQFKLRGRQIDYKSSEVLGQGATNNRKVSLLYGLNYQFEQSGIIGWLDVEQRSSGVENAISDVELVAALGYGVGLGYRFANEAEILMSFQLRSGSQAYDDSSFGQGDVTSSASDMKLSVSFRY